MREISCNQIQIYYLKPSKNGAPYAVRILPPALGPSRSARIPASIMISFLLKLLKPQRPLSTVVPDEDAETRAERLKAILRAELNRTQVDGKPISHRRLESLMQTTETSKRETVILLRQIGARPSSRHGSKVWTLRGN